MKKTRGYSEKLEVIGNPRLVNLINTLGKKLNYSNELSVQLERFSAEFYEEPADQSALNTAKLYHDVHHLSSFTYHNPAPRSYPRELPLVSIDYSNMSKVRDRWTYFLSLRFAPIRDHFMDLPISLWEAFSDVERRVGGFGQKADWRLVYMMSSPPFRVE